jgi:hypothetical protein
MSCSNDGAFGSAELTAVARGPSVMSVNTRFHAYGATSLVETITPLIAITASASWNRSKRLDKVALSAILLLGAVVAGYVYFTSLYLQDVLRFSPLEAGLAFIPATGTVLVTATQLTRRVLPRFGVRKILLAGLTITGLAQVWLFAISSTGSYQLNVLGGIVITAFGMGLVFPPFL